MKNNATLNAFLQSIFILLGNTFGIWFTYIVIEFLLKDVVQELTWPGFNSFIQNGSILTITFSILTSIILSTFIKLRINLYNAIAIILLISTTFIYVRCVGLNGRNMSLVFALGPFLLSSVLLFFTIKNQKGIIKMYSWLRKARNKDFAYDIFLSFAIAGNKNKANRDEVENYIAMLDSTLKECGYKAIFNASKYFNPSHEKQQPSSAAEEDFSAIENSRNFILFYPEEAASSALMELGYALRDQRNILIASKNVHTLPFLARGMAEVHENVNTFYYNDNFEDFLTSIKNNHKHYFK